MHTPIMPLTSFSMERVSCLWHKNASLSLPRCQIGLSTGRESLRQPIPITGVQRSRILRKFKGQRRIPSTYGRPNLRTVIASAQRSGALDQRAIDLRLDMASHTGRVDLSDCGLEAIPARLFEVTDLQDLSLAGNRIRELPREIARLTQLRRLGLAGNQLTALPEEIGSLEQLEGLYLHGNLIRAVPEQIGQLARLKVLALAGNCLQELPSSVARLTGLVNLSVAGNLLKSLPSAIGELRDLKALALHGNFLEALPESLGQLSSLEQLWLQGNRLREVPGSIGGLVAVKEMSLADNRLELLPDTIQGLRALQMLLLYGNALRALPRDWAGLKQLRSLWLEGNPLDGPALAAALESMAHVRVVGIDMEQASRLPADTLANALRRGFLRLGETVATGRDGDGAHLNADGSTARMAHGDRSDNAAQPAMLQGYFKLVRAPSGSEAEDEPTDRPQPGNNGHPGASSSTRQPSVSAGTEQANVLVVAFGSAPGVPNWAGLLRRVREGLLPEQRRRFDILYLVDGQRAWFSPERIEEGEHGHDGGGAHASGEQDGAPQTAGEAANPYAMRLRAFLSSGRYARVMMLGDSMGGSAALLFSPFATSVLAFCPQVDLVSASIRPGWPEAELCSFRDALQQNVAKSRARITIHCGRWSHDVDQARLLPKSKVKLVVHDIDDHRAAKVLDTGGELVKIVQAALASEMWEASTVSV
eukprot:jgi/Mesvir1/18042/Mv09359-RA.2